VTDAVIEQQSRELDEVYPIVYLDKVRQDKQVINKSVYLALGFNIEGYKELLGVWLSENEGARFWLSVLTELQNRGVQDILNACVAASGACRMPLILLPETQIRLCILHMVHGAVKYVRWKAAKTSPQI